MLEVLTQDHMEFISNLEPDVFVYILSSISEGLTGIGMYLISLQHTYLKSTCTSSHFSWGGGGTQLSVINLLPACQLCLLTS